MGASAIAICSTFRMKHSLRCLRVGKKINDSDGYLRDDRCEGIRIVKISPHFVEPLPANRIGRAANSCYLA